jgi:hypothetical protein
MRSGALRRSKPEIAGQKTIVPKGEAINAAGRGGLALEGLLLQLGLGRGEAGDRYAIG